MLMHSYTRDNSLLSAYFRHKIHDSDGYHDVGKMPWQNQPVWYLFQSTKYLKDSFILILETN